MLTRERQSTLKIFEPMTAFTDLLITFFTSIWAVSLMQIAQASQLLTHTHWSNAFWMTAAGGLLGAISHGIGPNLPAIVRTIIWRLTLIAIGWTAFFMLMGTLVYIPSAEQIWWLKWLPVIFLIAFHIRLFIKDDFSVVIAFYVPVLAIVFITYFYGYFVLARTPAIYVIIGIIISFSAAFIQQKKVGLHKHFNHNDLFHIIQLVGLYLIYIGVFNTGSIVE